MAIKLKLNRSEIALISDALASLAATDPEDPTGQPAVAEMIQLRTKVRQAWFRQDRALQKLCCPATRATLPAAANH